MNEQDINTIIQMLDAKVTDNVSRITLKVEEGDTSRTVQEYHHGRCDVGSPWATGTVGNCD